jgi:hypothetical protein
MFTVTAGFALLYPRRSHLLAGNAGGGAAVGPGIPALARSDPVPVNRCSKRRRRDETLAHRKGERKRSRNGG